MTDAEPAQLVRDVLALADGGLGEPGAEARGDVSTRTSRPVSASTSVRSPTSGSSSSRGIADLDDEHRVALGDGAQLRQPVDGPAEVGDEDDLAAAAACRGRRSAVPPRACAPPSGSGWSSAPRAPSVSASRSVASSAGPAGPRLGSVGHRCGRRTSSTPRRLPRCAERWAIAMDDALGDVGLAAVGGAELHRGRGSRGRARSSARARGRGPGRAGWFIRAVTFQSIRRTSSPGSYGRTCASSVPPPRSRAR